MSIQIKRVYEPPGKSDGKRILVDRIWPRGLTKEQASIFIWMKKIAPSHELRKWFAHKPENYETFKQNYLQELQHAEARKLLDQIKEWSETDAVTLVYGAKDEKMNQAVILKEVIEGM